MALTGAHAPGATPLTEEDIRGLKLANITTQGELERGFNRPLIENLICADMRLTEPAATLKPSTRLPMTYKTALRRYALRRRCKHHAPIGFTGWEVFAEGY
jgi:hypothetical protein